MTHVVYIFERLWNLVYILWYIFLTESEGLWSKGYENLSGIRIWYIFCGIYRQTKSIAMASTYFKESFQLLKAFENGSSACESSTVPQIAMHGRYCGNPYSNWYDSFEVQIVILHFIRITIGIPTVTVRHSDFGAPSKTRTRKNRSRRILGVGCCAWNMCWSKTSSNSD